MDKGGSSAAPTWVTWAPNKYRELMQFFSEVKVELKKVTWPPRPEVQATTVVVIITTIFFGFYLWFLDLGFSWLLAFVFGMKK
jgi:preprotein translocase subunit SecE